MKEFLLPPENVVLRLSVNTLKFYGMYSFDV